MDGDDFHFNHTPDGFTAYRRWFVYAVLAASHGVDTWNVEVKKIDGNKFRITFVVSSSSWGLVGIPTASGNDMQILGIPTNVAMQMGTSTHDTFFSRLDYLLGKSETWVDCKLAKHRLSTNITTGYSDFMCNVTIQDQLPNNFPMSEVDRIFSASNDQIKKKRYLKSRNLKQE
jgi:hypothetical protein